ncbi:MAG: TonB-dependent siderophore receptor [Burkholderiaceae bacterium]|nr:TonB-dependent siderophore receptor [Burkholderiaceae bacterium]
MQPRNRRLPTSALLPLGALAAGFGLATAALAQTAPVTEPVESSLPIVRGKASAERDGKASYQAVETRIGKGKQELRDIPQSVTVVTEKLMDDRNLDTLKDALRNTSGISFMAAEGGEEDIRLRGFALQATGDIFVDGVRDPAFYDRDTFFADRVEVMRGSASMLFGRGSTGGAVNLVTKTPRLIDEHQVDLSVASHNSLRAVGDFNFKTGESSALRVAAMVNRSDNNGAGSSLDKKGAIAAYRFGIGEADEFTLTAFHLNNNNGMNYGMPWIDPSLSSPDDAVTLTPLKPTAYYGMASDYNRGTATQLTGAHTHRFSSNVELTSKLRFSDYTRDQRAGTVRFARANLQPDGKDVTLETLSAKTVISRGTQLKIQDMQTVHAQSDLNAKFKGWGLGHELQAGVDFAQEKKQVFTPRSAAQGGVNLTKPTTTLGSPDDGAWIDESARVLRTANEYTSRGVGAYVQDLVQVAPAWKILAGLRFDHLKGDYDSYAIPANAAGPVTTSSYTMKVKEWSKRLGVLFQPNERMSFHASAATSFNTSGDAYSLGATNVDTPPEQSINLELGAKIDSADGKFSSRYAIFQTTKLHERNTDPLVNLVVLSGKRHVAGFEMDFSGNLAPGWEVYGSYMWMPIARIDEGIAATASEKVGDRPSLTPRHSGTIWSSYQLTQSLRIGAGLTARSEQTPNRNPGWAAPGWVTADVMAEYAVIPKQLLLKLNVSNVADKLYADSLYTGHYVPGAGRMVSLTGSYKF